MLSCVKVGESGTGDKIRFPVRERVARRAEIADEASTFKQMDLSLAIFLNDLGLPGRGNGAVEARSD